jgi:hypothetical protein
MAHRSIRITHLCSPDRRARMNWPSPLSVSPLRMRHGSRRPNEPAITPESLPVESKQQLRVASHPFRLRVVRHLPPSRRTQLGQHSTPAHAKGESCRSLALSPSPLPRAAPRSRGPFVPAGSDRGYFIFIFGLKS